MDMHSPHALRRELPKMGLDGLAEQIAAARCAGIIVLRAKELLIRGRDGKGRRIGQAHQIVYTRPASTLAAREAVEITEDELPDVALQVDVVPDTRRRGLSLYEKWGLPEVWVEVPERRPRISHGPVPGLAIHLRTRLGFVQSPTSAAFPSWSAEEIHTALNEPEGRMSKATAAALRRVGRLMAADIAAGTEGDSIDRADDAETPMEDRIEALDEIFRLRGFAASPAFAIQVASLQRPLPTLLRAAYQSRDEEDFLERIGVAREIPLIP